MQIDDAICGYAICVWDTGDEAISESHICIDLSPMDGSSVDIFSSEPQ